jgi:hypothetical protein
VGRASCFATKQRPRKNLRDSSGVFGVFEVYTSLEAEKGYAMVAIHRIDYEILSSGDHEKTEK